MAKTPATLAHPADPGPVAPPATADVAPSSPPAPSLPAPPPGPGSWRWALAELDPDEADPAAWLEGLDEDDSR
jgi:hypothetical protein